MSKKVIFIADFFADQIAGGGELNNEELIDLLREKKYNVEKSILTVITDGYSHGSDYLRETEEENEDRR